MINISKMSTENKEEKQLLPHHEQLPLCTSRLPYRQGRKLTAVKVYTINNESNHLLIFGVPSLNLRKETKALFLRFGKVLQFNLSELKGEQFTETYHVKYEKIQSARIAKRMIDTKNFYGGSLHVCYAPELEAMDETRAKLLQRKRDVLFRLKKLERETLETKISKQNKTVHTDVQNDNEKIDSESNNRQYDYNVPIHNELKNNREEDHDTDKINMGNTNIIYLNKNKRKITNEVVIEKKFKPCYEDRNEVNLAEVTEIVDCTSIDKEVVSNINEGLNYNKFGNEVIKKVELKPLNRIIFKCNKNS